MTKRDIAKRLPVLSRLIRSIDHLRKQNAELTAALHQLITTDVASQTDPTIAADGLPVPPAVLRYLVAGTDDLEVFLRHGRAGAGWVAELLSRYHRPAARPARVLDFGCGCGRLLRHLNQIPNVELFGADCNAIAIQWCRNHLPFARVEANGFLPPLAFADNHFDTIYAFSVFTHLTEEAGLRWMAEFRRVLAPGGLLVATVHGSQFLERLGREEAARYVRGEMVLREQSYAGANVCGAFHPETYVRATLAAGFDVLEALPGGSKATPPQDAYILRVQK